MIVSQKTVAVRVGSLLTQRLGPLRSLPQTRFECKLPLGGKRMLSWLQSLKDNHATRREMRILDEIFEEQFDVPQMATLRKWPREKLHRHLADNRLNADQRIGAESELRRREAWDAPAKWTFIVFALSLIIATVAIIRTF